MDWFQQINDRTTVLTPNRRLAAFTAKKYQKAMRTQNTWRTLDILPFNRWLERLWQEVTLRSFEKNPFLLNDEQSFIVWENIIAASHHAEHLLRIPETAELAEKAFNLLKQYCIPLDHAALATTEDSRIFLTWAAAFQKECTDHYWLSSAELSDFLIPKISTISLPEKIILLGFTEITPQQQAFLDALHIEILSVQPEKKSAQSYRATFEKPEQEMRAMALHAKSLYEKDPTLSIACVVPNLEKERETVLRIFSEVFAPANTYILNPLTLPFNISAGKSLASFPPIEAALKILSLSENHLSIETIQFLLHSPFVGDAETEYFVRAKFLAKELRNNQKLFLLNDIDCPSFKKRLNNFFIEQKTLPFTQSPKQWITSFLSLLNIFGWPGERSCNSEEYQVIQRFLKLLAEFSFDLMLGKISYQKALRLLTRLTERCIFQPESPETPIQILGILEAASVPFDYIWVMTMDDLSWPSAPKPNPFIPKLLQKTLNMPHASPERELAFCQTITEQLKNSAQHIIFSFAKHQEEKELQASALIENLEPFSFEEKEDSSLKTILFQQKMIETFTDKTAPPISDKMEITGGAKLFELQSACPFKAFAEIRLKIKNRIEKTIGLTAIDRGIITHKILELIFNDLKDSESLNTITDKKLLELIQKAIATALKPYQQKNFSNKRYFAIESQRLEKIILDWMLFEKTRPAFTVIAQEEKFNITIGNLNITLRIDRIDHVEGGKLIIDYKTGKQDDIKYFFGERPTALQLPLYCLIDETHTVGLAFSKLNAEKMAIQGISKLNLNIKNIKSFPEVSQRDASTWSEQLTHWKKTLQQLSIDFCNGIAHVDPKEPNTCEHCQLKPVCRIQEKNL